MLFKLLYVTGLLVLMPVLLIADEKPFLQDRDQLIEKYLELKNSALSDREALTDIADRIIEIDEALLKQYRDSLLMLTPVKQRILALQQEKQIYLAQNIKLSADVEDLRKQQTTLYIISAFLGLMFIALFILFLIQLNKIKELATEAHELYEIGEHTRSELAKYEKRFYVMKEANADIRQELNKNKEHLSGHKEAFENIKKQLNEEIAKNRRLTEKLKKYGD